METTENKVPAKVIYEHICKNPDCQKVFKHESRNTRYCSDECRDKMNVRNRALDKRRKHYKKNSPMFRAQSISRKQARYLAINEKVKHRCDHCHQEFFIKDLECAHLDGNCFNNAIENLGLLCPSCHTKYDCAQEKAGLTAPLTPPPGVLS